MPYSIRKAEIMKISLKSQISTTGTKIHKLDPVNALLLLKRSQSSELIAKGSFEGSHSLSSR